MSSLLYYLVPVLIPFFTLLQLERKFGKLDFLDVLVYSRMRTVSVDTSVFM